MLRAMNYKPGYWAAYAVYVAIPISVYVAYLVRRAREVYGSYSNVLCRIYKLDSLFYTKKYPTLLIEKGYYFIYYNMNSDRYGAIVDSTKMLIFK